MMLTLSSIEKVIMNFLSPMIIVFIYTGSSYFDIIVPFSVLVCKEKSSSARFIKTGCLFVVIATLLF